MARSGGRWRDLPERYGNDHTAKTRDDRWIKAGILENVFATLAQEADLDWVSIDATSIRTQAATARRKKGVILPFLEARVSRP